MAKKVKIYNWAYIDNNMVVLTGSTSDESFSSETRIMINSISSVSKIRIISKANKIFRFIGWMLILIAVGLIIKASLPSTSNSVPDYSSEAQVYSADTVAVDADDDEYNSSDFYENADKSKTGFFTRPSNESIIISAILAIIGIIILIICVASKSCTMSISCCGETYFVGIGSDNTEDLYSQLVGILFYRR